MVEDDAQGRLADRVLDAERDGDVQPVDDVVDDKPRLDVIRDNMQDTVIWNPWKEGAEAIADFEPKDVEMAALMASKVTPSALALSRSMSS